MRHIDITPLIDAVKKIELQETVRLMKQNVRKKTFRTRVPSVEYYSEGSGPASADVKSIRLAGSDSVIIEVYDSDNGGTFELTPEDLYPGSLLAIIDMM